MRKILIVDYLGSSLEKIKSILSRPGFQVISTNSPHDVLDILHGDEVDLLISELDMPGINGDDLCSKIRHNKEIKNVSIIIIGHHSESSLQRFKSSGANAFLGKPLSPQELNCSVNELLNVHGRQNYRVLVKVTIKGEAKNESFFCTSQNLSVSGVLLKTTQRLSSGDTIACSFFLRSSNISVNGEVVREEIQTSDIHQYGIKFLNPPSHVYALINDFVESRKS